MAAEIVVVGGGHSLLLPCFNEAAAQWPRKSARTQEEQQIADALQ